MPSDSIRTKLTAASSLLRKVDPSVLNDPDITPASLIQAADAVDAVLAPNGWWLLVPEETAEPEPEAEETEQPKRNLPFSFPKHLRDKVNRSVKRDPLLKHLPEKKRTLTLVVEKGFEEFLAGRFRPLPPLPGKQVHPEGVVNLNVRVKESLRKQAQEAGAKPGNIATQYLMFRYKLGRYAPDVREPLKRGALRLPEVPRWVRDEIRRGAQESGDWVNDLVNEGLQKFLDGTFEAFPRRWSEEDRQDMVPLSMNPNDDLYEQVQRVWEQKQQEAESRWKTLSAEEQAKEREQGMGKVSPTVGWPYPHGGVRPSQVAIDYLLDQFGIDAGEHHAG
jgi:hypothetical protein